jgi:hypothetical protein
MLRAEGKITGDLLCTERPLLRSPPLGRPWGDTLYLALPPPSPLFLLPSSSHETSVARNAGDGGGGDLRSGILSRWHGGRLSDGEPVSASGSCSAAVDPHVLLSSAASPVSSGGGRWLDAALRDLGRDLDSRAAALVGEAESTLDRLLPRCWPASRPRGQHGDGGASVVVGGCFNCPSPPDLKVSEPPPSGWLLPARSWCWCNHRC